MDVVLYGGGTHGHGDIEMPSNGVVSGVNGLMLEVKKYVKAPLGGHVWHNAIFLARIIGFLIAVASTILLIKTLAHAEASPEDVVSSWYLIYGLR